MKDTQKLLREGHPDRAVGRLATLLETHPDKMRELTNAMGAFLIQHYRQCQKIVEIHSFCKLMGERLPAPVPEALMKLMAPQIRRTQHWRKELEGVTRERLGRETRAMVVRGDIKEAAHEGLALIRRGKTPAARTQLARYLIEALATLYRDHERGAKVIASIAKVKDLGELEFDLNEAYAERLQKKGQQKFEESDREWTQVFSAASVSIREFCPGPNETGEPNEEDLQKFSDEISAVLRAGLVSRNPDDFLDALRIVSEYCPVDPAATPSVAGAEPRSFLGIGPKAKLTAVRALGKLGDCAPVRDTILEFAQTPAAAERVSTLSAVMGGLRKDQFIPYLKQAIEHAKTPKEHNEIIDALGRIANPDAAELISGELKKCMKKIADTAYAPKAKLYLTAMGRIGRRREIDALTRNEMVADVIASVGERDWNISFFAAQQMFSNNPNQLERPHRAWAVKQIVRALFGLDTGSDMRVAAQTHLGFRQPMVTALNRLGSEMLPEVLEAAAPHMVEYSGAFPAFAESIEKIGDGRAVNVLEQMIRSAFMHGDEPNADRLKQDKVRDAATGQMVDLNRDEVLHSLLHALSKVGGLEGQKIILGFADQIQAGQLESPGTGTASFLVGAKREHGTLGKRETVDEGPVEEFSEKEIERALTQCKGGMFINSRKQVEALALLGRARRPETATVILQALASKDAVVYNAAEAALTQFMTPPPATKAFEEILFSLFSKPRMIKEPARGRLFNVISRSFPKKPPYDKIFKRQIAIDIADEQLAHRLQGAFVAGLPAARLEALQEAGGEDAAGDEPSPMKRKMEEMKLKRVYLEARRQWFQTGKQGPPPKPPDLPKNDGA